MADFMVSMPDEMVKNWTAGRATSSAAAASFCVKRCAAI